MGALLSCFGSPSVTRRNLELRWRWQCGSISARSRPARVRRWLFERLCIVNTLLFAGFDGYLVKLWMVDPATSDYAGLYTWESAGAADRYGSYITAILRPFSRPGSVGYAVLSNPTVDDYLNPRSRAE